ncbi:hypothetical protein A1O3_07355 [Capronia epimyces CBS 606.96]|uniref:NAD(P)-binding domain-containing protein n=1 Tax=Capronia epimyces CBS 606.96 TaxID=1182542 RepID=W9XKL2_9EURO|nr:uncharacterized protein A1O3_07355 [Capronia epimyces CBS 606.96]EXJ81067.1 hypothetical protein A1O3_07355 [Capronia epimyces CBS 606.96]
MPSVLLFGATGLIGSRLAVDLKTAHPEWPLTVFVRSPAAESYFKSAAVDRIVYGSFSDTDLVRSLSKEHDIVINAATSFDGDFITQVIAAMEEKPEHSKGTLIHLSGTGNFIDHGTTGSFNPDSKVWNDDNEEDIKLINRNMLNGPSDTPVLEAGERGKIVTYVVCVAATYGPNIGPSSSLGLIYTILTSNSKQLGYVPYVGDGTSVVSTIHVADVVPFVTKVVGIAGTQEPQGSAYSRYYMLHGERVAWKDLAAALAKTLYAKGVVGSPEPKSVPMEQAGEGPKGLIASNMLIRGDRAARLGFKATQPSMLVSIDEDLARYSL